MSNYFKTIVNEKGQEYASNSALTKFGQDIGIFETFEGDPDKKEEALRLGTLFDILETEKHRIDRLNGRIIGTDYTFSESELMKYERKQRLLYSQPFYEDIMAANPDFQKEVYCDNFTLDNMFYLPFKGKLDLYLPGFVIDLKTTAATSQGGFDYTCERFGYFRQMIFYMKLTGAKQSLLIGISKPKDRIFKVHFNENHEKYQENLYMCKLLIQKYCIIN